MVQHKHRHWTDTRVVQCKEKPTEKEVIAALKLNYTPNFGERIVMTELNPVIIVR